jgi:hypothetical protein
VRHTGAGVARRDKEPEAEPEASGEESA